MVIVDDEIVEGPVDRLYTLTVVNGNDLIGDNTTFTITESDNDGRGLILFSWPLI